MSSGSTTTHADFSQYDSFIFDLSINQFPPADRSDFYHKEFADELAHIIYPSEYDCFCFKIEPELGDFTMDVVGDIFPTKEPRVHVPNVCLINKIFDPGIFIGVQSKIFLSRDAFSISFIHDHLFDTLLPFSSKNEDKVVNTGILAVGEENLLSSLMLYGSFLLFSRIAFILRIFSPSGIKIPFLTPTSPFIILLCRVYLIGVELS
ncbi:hypothetical protein Tco_0816956 [Tanacetum coccineum]